MKKFKGYIIGFVLGSLFFSGISYAASGEIKATLSNFIVKINGEQKTFSNNPVVINGYTYLPLRDVAEAVGYTIGFENGVISLESIKTPELNTNATTHIDEKIIEPEVLNDYLDNSSSPALKYNDNVYLPLRQGAEKFGINPENITWNGETSTISFINADIELKVQDSPTNSSDSFIYQGRSYVKEEILKKVAEIQKKQSEEAELKRKQLEEEQKTKSGQIDLQVEPLKSMFTVGEKKLNIANVIEVDAKYNGSLSVGEFEKFWMSLEFKNKLFDAIAIEQQKINPKYQLYIRFTYNNTFLGNTMADVGGTASTYIVENPFPNQDSIIQ